MTPERERANDQLGTRGTTDACIAPRSIALKKGPRALPEERTARTGLACVGGILVQLPSSAQGWSCEGSDSGRLRFFFRLARKDHECCIAGNMDPLLSSSHGAN